MVYLIMFPYISYKLMRKFREILGWPEYRKKFGSMYTNLEVLKVESIVYVLLFLGRRLIFAYQIGFCSGFVVGQIAINIYSTSIMLQYLVSV